MTLSRRHHGLAITTWSLSLLSLSFVTLGLNGNWWGYIKVNDVASFLAPLKLKPEDVRFEIDIGLSSMSLNAIVYSGGTERGFSGRSDNYLWGILAVQCEMDKGKEIGETECTNRRTISSLSSVVHIVLSIASVLISGTVMLLAFSQSPSVYMKTTFIMFGSSLVTLLSAMLIFEARLKGLLNDPKAWGIFDEEIHTSIAGVDHLLHFPHESTTFDPRSVGISPTFVWLGFCLLLCSLVTYTIRLRRTWVTKKYVLSMTFADERKGDPISFLKSRRQ